MWLQRRLYSRNFLTGSLAVVALLGSAIGAIAFDYDHPIAFLLGIEKGRFLHHPTAICCCVVLLISGWWIIKLVYRLSILRRE